MQPQIFISYSWKNSDIADTIDEDWEKVGIRLIRDVRDLKYKEKIKDFMKRVKDSDYVLLLISKAYLVSKNCMYEALEMFEDPSFKEKILPILTEDARIDKPTERLSYIQYWEEEVEKLNKEIKNLKSHANASSIYQELEHYTKIRASIDRFIDEINSLLYIPWQEAKQSSYRPIFKSIGFDSDHVAEKCIRINQLIGPEDKEIALDELAYEYPNNEHVLFTKAIVATDEKKYRKAKQTYERIIALFPNNMDAHNNLALLLADHLQDYGQAKKHYEQALRIKPDYARAHLNLGNLLTDHFKEYDQARKHYEQALQIKPAYAKAHYNLARLLTKHFHQDKELARKHYEQAQEIDPNLFKA